MLFCFTSISAEILLHILGYSFFIEHHILAGFCQMLLPLKASNIICNKLLVKLTHRLQFLSQRQKGSLHKGK
jgi:hypothetical protein